MIEISKERQESVKLDEVMRLLFDMSKPVLVNMINNLFGERFDPDIVEISKDNGKFVNEQLNMLEGDFFLRIVESSGKPHLYHIEFQTFRDDTISVRILQYDIEKAIERENMEQVTKQRRRLYLSHSIVIQVEPHDDIPDAYIDEIVFEDGFVKERVIPVLKYWTLTTAEMVERGLYPLLPLQVFLQRSRLDKMTKANDEEQRQKAIHEAKDIAMKMAHEAKELHQAGKLMDADLRKVLTAIANLFAHLNNRYKVKPGLNEEVSTMIELDFSEKHLYEIIEKKGKKEIATKMLAKNKPIEEIMEFTELTESEIKDIEKTLVAV